MRIRMLIFERCLDWLSQQEKELQFAGFKTTVRENFTPDRSYYLEIENALVLAGLTVRESGWTDMQIIDIPSKSMIVNRSVLLADDEAEYVMERDFFRVVRGYRKKGG